ncbi:2-hydroxyacid dehydrogenase [Oceanicola sp. 22II-s10i]|uniref:2-hydroxyacid dehydrogenase n=1 Tax=Oceanicola sp. 22II-s10i TaxID=1317116 RepID=UPI000B526F19|nr:D-glycerate dehydrogenase [Oceanicola sp. 22II-s10i]OWU84266.1 2-hydroxyacid dehydrogenase [Oceanicola sp. 22II-s10i]
MTRVLVTRPLPARVLAEAERHFEIEVRDVNGPMKRSQLRAALVLHDGVLATLGDAFDEQAFAEFNAPRCRIIANFGVGYNHIDVAAARGAGIAVTNTPGAVTDATADVAMTLLLMTARRAGEGERLVRAGKWTGWHPTQMLGRHVTGKTVGIVGMGRIGQAVAQRCHYGFGMDVLYANRSEKAVGFPARQVTLEALARAADFVVVAVPGGADTRHLLDEAFFAAMRPEAIFVNIARGDVVDEAALIAALKAGRIAGAGLDVYENEPTVPEALRKLENVSLLPHLGTAALEVREAMGLMAVENLRAFFAGETPPNLVN